MTREFCIKYAAKSAKLDSKDVEARRARVITEIQGLLDKKKPLTIDNINDVFTPKVLNGAVDSIDKHFFDNDLKSMFESKKKRCCFSICMENECMILKGSKIAGNCKIDSKGITINLSTKVLQEAFKTERKNRVVGKVPCTDILSCLLLILEHELVHALIQCDCPYSKFDDRGDKLGSPVEKLKIDVATYHSSTFMAILNNRFNHKDFYVSIHGDKFDKEDFKVGDIIGVRKKADFPNFKTGKKFAKFKSVEVTGVSSTGVRVTLTDKGIIRTLYGRELYDPVKHKRVDLGLIPFENVVNKVESVQANSKSPVKPESPKPVVRSEPKKNTIKKPLCNKRNPAPPCPEGMVIKKRPNGEECCYKSTGKPVVKSKKVSPVAKPVSQPKPAAKPVSPSKPVAKPVSSPKPDAKDLRTLEPSFDFVAKPVNVIAIDSELDYKKLKPETKKYIDSLPRYKLNKKVELNQSGIFSADKPTHLILKVGVKYLLVDTSGSSYVRYATKIIGIPTPSKGFSDLYSK